MLGIGGCWFPAWSGVLSHLLLSFFRSLEVKAERSTHYAILSHFSSCIMYAYTGNSLGKGAFLFGRWGIVGRSSSHSI